MDIVDILWQARHTLGIITTVGLFSLAMAAEEVSLREFMQLQYAQLNDKIAQVQKILERTLENMASKSDLVRLADKVEAQNVQLEALRKRVDTADTVIAIIRKAWAPIGVVLLALIIGFLKQVLGL